MLRIDVRDLQRGPVRTDVEVPPDHEALRGLEGTFDEPIRLQGTLSVTAHASYVWHGIVAGRMIGACRRCLVETPHRFAVEARAVFSADPELESDPNVYPLPPAATVIDLTDVVRQEVALAIPAFPLCREDCAGLCPQCGADRNEGPCPCGPGTF